MFRVLQVVPNMNSGGIENLLMNIYRNIDREQIQFDFLVHYEKECYFDKEIEELGGQIYRLSVREDGNILKYIRDLKSFFHLHNEYKIIHGHMASLAFVYLGIAKQAGIPFRIVHSHNTSAEKSFKGRVKWFLCRFAKINASHYIACGTEAGIYLFGRSPFIILNNAIDIARFQYDEKRRSELRKKYKADDKFIIGNVARFNLQKNHVFLIDVFEEIYKKNHNAQLWLLGSGELENSIRNKVKEKGLEKVVFFWGVRKNTEDFYQMMDCFLFPSLFEGLPLTVVEAQTAGLQCYVSDTVTKEVKVTDNVYFISLQDTPIKWAEKILDNYPYQRKNQSTSIKQAGFDLKNETDKLLNFYVELEGK